MATKSLTKNKPVSTSKPARVRPKAAAPAARALPVQPAAPAVAVKPIRSKETAKEREARERRQAALQKMLVSKRQEIIKEIEESLGQSLTTDQQRRLESARDVGDQALMDLDRELGISLMEMRNRRRKLIDEALRRLREGTYGMCAECGVEISEKRLQIVPFAKLCVVCQSKEELLEKIEKEEVRD